MDRKFNFNILESFFKFVIIIGWLKYFLFIWSGKIDFLYIYRGLLLVVVNVFVILVKIGLKFKVLYIFFDKRDIDELVLMSIFVFILLILILVN